MTGDMTFASGTAAATDRIQVRSGGLMVNGARTIAPGISFGTAPQEANIFNNNTLVIGLNASPTTTGQITNATHVVKQGAGTLVIDSPQASFNGNWIVNQGSIAFRSATVQSNLGGTASLAQMNLGTNGLVVLNGFGSQLQLRSDATNTIYNLGLVIGEGNPYAVLNGDRGPANTGSPLNIMTGGIRFGGSPGEQGQTLFVNNAANNLSVQVNGPLVLSAATMEGAPAYNFIRTDPNLTVYGNRHRRCDPRPHRRRHPRTRQRLHRLQQRHQHLHRRHPERPGHCERPRHDHRHAASTSPRSSAASTNGGIGAGDVSRCMAAR